MVHFAFSQSYPNFETVDELFDWYRVCMDGVEKNYSTVGHAKIYGTGSTGSVVYDWFNVGLEQKGSARNAYYSEVRRTFAGGAAGGVWEKYLTRGEETYYSMGPFSNPLGLLPKPKIGPDGKPMIEVSRHMVVPNMYMLAIVSNSAYTALHAEKPFLLSEIEGLRVLEGKIEDGIAKGFLFHNQWGLEIEFRKEFGWMPTRAKGYFRDQDKKGAVDRSHFSTLHYEIESEWVRVSDDDHHFVPKKIVNRVVRINPVSKNSQTMEVSSVWILGKISAEQFNDESVNAERDSKGPLNELKQELFQMEKSKTNSAPK